MERGEMQIYKIPSHSKKLFDNYLLPEYHNCPLQCAAPVLGQGILSRLDIVSYDRNKIFSVLYKYYNVVNGLLYSVTPKS